MSDPVRSWSDEELVLFAYGDEGLSPADRESLGRELAVSPALAARLAAWQGTIALVELPEAPARGAGYGAEVWSRIADRLAAGDVEAAPSGVREPASRPVVSLPAVVGPKLTLAHRFRRALPFAIAATLLLVAGFLAGRLFPPAGQPGGITAADLPPVATEELPGLSEAARERILQSAVVGHLAQAEMLLLEVANGNLDPGAEANRAAVLTAANRLYRGAAQQSGAGDVAQLLGELERILLEVAHLPADADRASVAALAERLSEADLLFKVRIVQARLRHSVAPPRGDRSLAGNRSTQPPAASV